MEGQTRIGVGRQKDKRVTLIVAQQNVIARLEGLDQIVFKQQRFVFGVRHGYVHRRHALQHRLGAGAVRAAQEVACNPLAQITRLAYVQHFAGGA